MIQIFGTKKCKDTAKAMRFFRERNIKFHFIDLSDKGLSRGELLSIAKSIPLMELIDSEGREFEKLNLKYMKFNPEDEILEHPLIIKTPVVRSKNNAYSGHKPDMWKELADKEKGE